MYDTDRVAPPPPLRETSYEFLGDEDGNVTGLKTSQVDWAKPVPGGAPFSRVENTEQMFECDLVFLAMGFLGPEQFLAEQLGIETDPRSNYKADMNSYTTSIPSVFAAGDCRRGQSLIVWAIREGREAAHECDRYLMGVSDLPR